MKGTKVKCFKLGKMFLKVTETNGGVCVVLIVKVLGCGIVVNEFELQSLNYVHFWINTFGKGMNPPSHGLNSTTTVLLEEWLWH